MAERHPLYAIPVLGRYGLTHGMLAWARCRLWCAQNDAQMIAPFWLKPRIGPYLRRERDKRNYFLLFDAGQAISGARRLWTLATAKLVDIGPEWPTAPAPDGGGKATVLRFHNAVQANEIKSFHQIIGHGPFLRDEVLAITRPRYHPPAATAPFIAVHVRMGDFTKASGPVSATATNTRLPIDWYADRLSALRLVLASDVPAIVFSDGEDADLAPLLALPGVTRAPHQQSVTDLLQMGQGVAVIASGSGFSLWGAFLGSAPRIAFPGQSIVPISTDLTRDIQSDFGAAIPATFVEHVRARAAG
jgi:hypothetical protein